MPALGGEQPGTGAYQNGRWAAPHVARDSVRDLHAPGAALPPADDARPDGQHARHEIDLDLEALEVYSIRELTAWTREEEPLRVSRDRQVPDGVAVPERGKDEGTRRRPGGVRVDRGGSVSVRQFGSVAILRRGAVRHEQESR